MMWVFNALALAEKKDVDGDTQRYVGYLLHTHQRLFRLFVTDCII